MRVDFAQGVVASPGCGLAQGARMWEASCPTIPRAASCWVLGERINRMRCVGSSWPGVSSHGILERTKEMMVSFSAIYQIWSERHWGWGWAARRPGGTFVREGEGLSALLL